jgi:hypothetical protein
LNSQTVVHSADQEREANLRRLDWRFLLPNSQTGTFRHLLLFGGPKGLANRIEEANLAEQVSCEIYAGCRADAAIILHDSRVEMEQAAACLEQGGVLYQEIARDSLSALRMTPNHLRRRLNHAGLTLTGLYWAAPNFEQSRRYIPLDVPGAVHWYFSSLFVAGTPIHQLIRTLFRLVVGKNSQRLGWFVPCLSVTAVAGSTSTHPPSVLNHPHVANALRKDNLRPMILTSGQDDASRLIMLPFASQHSQHPQAVIKIATDPKFNVETEVEQTVLQEVRARLDTKMRQSVPEPLGSFHYHNLAVGVESCAPGSSVWVSSGGWGASSQTKIADAELSTKWLIEFHRQTEIERLSWDHRAIERWIDAPLAAYAQLREMSEAEQRLFISLRVHANTLLGAELPLVWQHNDFAPWNLYRAGEQLTVLDWEFNRNWDTTRAGPALCDLLYFATYWNNIVHHHYTEEAELRGMYGLFLEFAPRSRYIYVARRAIAQYMAALRIDWRFLPLLLAYTWTERVVYSHARLQKLERPPSTSRAADKFAKYIGLLATHAQELFSANNGGFWQGYAYRRSKMSDQPPTSGALE